MKNLVTLIIMLFISSCASVEFYSDSKLKKETGLKYYQSKPFLLVETNPQKDIKTKSTIIYLPDISSPSYVKVKPGFGTANLTIGLKNGMISSFGAITDSKIPESIQAITGITTGLSGVYSTLVNASNRSAIDDTEQQSGDEENHKKIERAKILLNNVLKDIEKIRPISSNGDNIKTPIITFLISIIDKLEMDETSSMISIAKEIRKIPKEIGKLKGNKTEKLNGIIDMLITEINSAANILNMPKKPISNWELYEIENKNGNIVLKQVIIEKNETGKKN